MESQTQTLLLLYLYIKSVALESKIEGIVESFSNRKYLQKFIYILQEIVNVELDYKYNLYIHGPYSPDLAKDLFILNNHQNNFIELATKYTFNESGVNDINIIKSIIDKKTPSISDLDWLEALSTFHFLFTKTYCYEAIETRKSKCHKYIHQNKPHLHLLIDPVYELLLEKNYISGS